MIFAIKNFFYILFLRIGAMFASFGDALRHLFYKRAERIDSAAFKKETDTILNEFDQEYRYKEVNDLTPSANEFVTNILYTLERLYEKVINATNRVYKKIQLLEAHYSSLKSELDNKLYYELHNLEEKREHVEREINELEEEIERYKNKKEALETEFGKLENKEVVGDLHRHPKWFFWIVMIPAGMAEFFIYKSVFMSQELNLPVDMLENERFMYEVMSGVMSVGFIVMIIWMAHALGKFIRYFSTATKKERPYYIAKMLLITLVSAGAIWATVDIRGQMHEIMAINTKVQNLKSLQDKKEEEKLFGGDAQEENGLLDDEEEEDGGGLDDEDEEDAFGDEDEPASKSHKEIKGDDTEAQIAELEHQAVVAKDATAPVFMLINIFIFLGGVFLSYFVHSSSPTYDMIEDELKKLQRRKKRLQKELLRIDKEIMIFKKYVIDPLFQRLLKEAALYDLHVRIYNAYLELFYMQVEIVVDYLTTTFERFGVQVEPVDYKALLREHITIDDRKELHHVNRIEEYMIYKYTPPQKVKNLHEETKK